MKISTVIEYGALAVLGGFMAYLGYGANTWQYYVVATLAIISNVAAGVGAKK